MFQDIISSNKIVLQYYTSRKTVKNTIHFFASIYFKAYCAFIDNRVYRVVSDL